MTLTKETVRKVARLARLRMDDQKIDFYHGKLSNIMKFVEQLSEVNTDKVEPLPSPVDISLALRPDAITDGNCQDAVLSNAPESLEGFYVVPKVVE